MNEVDDLLPHRDPFLFVDEIIKADEKKITAKYVFKENEYFFKGHFPQYPVVPGVILVEAMVQSGAAGLRKCSGLDYEAAHLSALFFLAAVNNVKFRRQVRPGEEVRCEIVNLRVSSKMFKQEGKAYVGDELAAEAEWMCLAD